jgi:phosphatidylserine/phosphatidylglycerophosphate/cardiolipin synthase-like enzyme
MKQLATFLKDNDILIKLREAIRRSKGIDLAVAYWGANACKTLGLNLIKGPVRIICDAHSGACNPDELKILLKKGFDVKTRIGLHAKVAITSKSVIVGSANASTNGLGQEGEEANNIEAAAFIVDREFLATVQTWFDSLWKQFTFSESSTGSRRSG